MILERILEYCRQIQGTCSRLGGFEAFRHDYLYQNAVCMCLLQIGELSGKLSEETRAEIANVPWREIRAFRNVCAHNYGAVVFAQVWETVEHDIPALMAAIQDAML